MEKEKRKRGFCVSPILEKRTLHDMEACLLKDILWEDGIGFLNFCPMTIHQFEEILAMVKPNIDKIHTTTRYPIKSRVRLAITLRYIASGDSFRSLECVSHISRKTMSKFIPQVLAAIVDTLEGEYIKTPSSKSEWYQVESDFDQFWQFPHTLGSVDKKHIRIKAPPQSGSDFYNNEGFFSIVLLAVVDAFSRFIYIDVGGNRRASDAFVLKNCSLYQALMSDQLNIPPASRLKGQAKNTPYYFIGDDIFGLDNNFLKAYDRSSNLSTSQEVFNYRLSRARLTVEMAFGTLAARFRIFDRPLEISLSGCDVLIRTCCVLHNYLSRKLQSPFNAEQESPAINLPQTITPLAEQVHNKYKYACNVRDNVCKYCVTDGNVSFQWDQIKKKQTIC